MTRLTRRLVVLGALGTGALGLGWRTWRQYGALNDMLGGLFGDDIAAHPAARQFAKDYLARFGPAAGLHPASVARLFLQSSNFLEAETTGAPLTYDGLFDPYETPCANRLAAAWEP